MSEAPEKKVPPRGGRKPGSRSLTVSQKAEAAALWRAGEVTLEELSKRFGKRPATFSALFERMGIKKGSGAAEALRKAEAAVASKVVDEVEENLKRIAQVKDSHFKMSQALAVMAFREIQRAKAAELDIGRLKDTMATIKMCADVVGNSRKELFEILNVAKHEEQGDMNELPDLTVRELTQSEVLQLQGSPVDDVDGADLGDSMMDLE